MDEKTKLYVFAKKEVALIFIFMFLIAITSFVMGVKVGKSYFYEMAGISKEDQNKVVELLSEKEESLQELKKEAGQTEVGPEELHQKLEEKIGSEFAGGEHGAPQASEHATVATEAPLSKIDTHAEAASPTSKSDTLSGKFTVQLSSHRTLKEAEDFAEGFKARGYDPIITEYDSKAKGTWYRVSIGAFSSQEEARGYINKEKSLFLGQDFTIQKLP